MPEIKVDDEDFSFKKQGADNLGSYDFVEDIERLERVACAEFPDDYHYIAGYCILLTNNWSYWKQTKDGKRQKKSQNNEFFPIDECERKGGQFLRGKQMLYWYTGKSEEKRRPLELLCEYQCKWTDYRNIQEFMTCKDEKQEKYREDYGEFRYLLLRVPGQPCLEQPQ